MTNAATAAFEDTESGRILTNAVQYLQMARLVVDTDTFRNAPRRFNRPILNTLGVGVELYLKSVLLSLGKDMETVRGYGHRLERLWNDVPQHIRETIFTEAENVHDDLLASGMDIGVRPPQFRSDFEAMLRNLSDRHWRDGSQLRYLAPAGTMAPRAGLMVYAFEAAATARLESFL